MGITPSYHGKCPFSIFFDWDFPWKKPSLFSASLKGYRSGAQAAGQCEGPLGPWSRCESTLEDGSQQPQGVGSWWWDWPFLKTPLFCCGVFLMLIQRDLTSDMAVPHVRPQISHIKFDIAQHMSHDVPWVSAQERPWCQRQETVWRSQLPRLAFSWIFCAIKAMFKAEKNYW